MTWCRAALAGGVLVAGLSTVPAGAVTLGLATAPPSLAFDGAIVEFDEFLGTATLSGFGILATGSDGITPTGDTFLLFNLLLDSADPTLDPIGGFEISDDTGTLLEGEVTAIGFTQGIIEAAFGPISGSEAAGFPLGALATFDFGTQLPSDNPFDDLAPGAGGPTALTADIGVEAVVPLPVAGWMALAGYGILGLLALRRRRAAVA